MSIVVTYGFIQTFDRLPNWPSWLVIVCVPKATAPMTEVRRNHEQILGIGEIWREQLAIHFLHIRIKTAHQHRHNGELIFKVLHDFCNIWQMHLNRMLINVRFHVHPLELLCCVQLGDNFRINFEIIKRRFVFLTDGQCTLPEADVMRWSKNEDSLHGGRWNLTIGPCCGLAAVRVSGMRLKREKRLSWAWHFNELQSAGTYSNDTSGGTVA